MSTVEYIISGIVLLLMLSVIPVVLFSINRDVAEKFRLVAATLNGTVRRSLLRTPRIEGHHEGLPFQILYAHGMQNTPPILTVRYWKPPGFLLSLRKENVDTRLSKKIGLMKEVEIGVPDFDAEFLVGTDDGTRCQIYLSSTERRQQIRKIYDAAGHIQFRRDRIEVSKALLSPGEASASRLNPEEALNLLEEAVRLGRDL